MRCPCGTGAGFPAAAVALALAAFGFAEAGWGLPENFAKLFAAVFAGWAFLVLFERLSWVVLVAVLIPFVDSISVWRGPTHSITTHHFHVYLDVAIAFVVPAGRAAYLGPPDVLFYALFLAAAARWNLRVWWTWFATTFMYGITIVIANAVDVGGLPALPFLSFGFLLANADLLWASLRRRSVFFGPGVELTADSPNVNGARNDAITAKMIPIATANHPPPES